MSGLLAILGRIPAVAWLVLALASWGFYGAHNARAERTAKATAAFTAATQATAAAQASRAREQTLNKRNLEISDAITLATAARATAQRTAAARLRDLANANAAHSAALAACRSYAGPAVALLPDTTRDALVNLASRADAVADSLLACQAYVRDVVQP